MADQNDKPKKSSHWATSVILAFSAILGAAPTLGLDQAIAKHGESLTEVERNTLKSLSADEVQALASINIQLEAAVALTDNNNNNNNNDIIVDA